MATSTHAGHHHHSHRHQPQNANANGVVRPVLCPPASAAAQPQPPHQLPPRASPSSRRAEAAAEPMDIATAAAEDMNSSAASRTTTSSSSSAAPQGSLSPRRRQPPTPQRQQQQVPLPSPQEMAPAIAANTMPPEMERETNRWRQYAAAVLFQGRKGLSPLGMEEDDDDAGDDEGAEGDAEEFRGRRTTVTYRFPTTNGDQATTRQQQYRRPRAGGGLRKLSMGHQRHSAEEVDPAAEEAFAAMVLNEAERRLSFPERSLLSANYAILRKSVDRFEVIGAFHRFHTEAYRHFLQSLTCYDLAPQHGLIVMLDAELTIQKAIQVLVAHPAPRVAIISNVRDGYRAMFTVTDCLMALQKAHREGDANFGANTLNYIVEHFHGGRRLISVDDQSSVWDLARVFALNRVHRVPVFSGESGELMAVLCPRAICMELLKLISSKCSLSPDLNVTLLNSHQVGTWGESAIVSINETESCARAVDLFLDHRQQMSALPVLCASTGALLGVVDKNNLLDKLFDQLGSQPTPERCMQLMAETPVKDLLPLSRSPTVRSDVSVAEAMRVLAEDGLSESLFVLGSGNRLCGVLSHTDILEYILRCENGGGGGNGGGRQQQSSY